MVAVHWEVGMGAAETTLMNVSTSCCVTSLSRLSMAYCPQAKVLNPNWTASAAIKQQKSLFMSVSSLSPDLLERCAEWDVSEAFILDGHTNPKKAFPVQEECCAEMVTANLECQQRKTRRFSANLLFK